jgi:phosphoglycolate phosphatase
VMAVCTNKPTAFSRKILEFLELAHFFRAIVGPDLAGARKPDARHVLHTLESTSCRCADALFVGDMPIDVHAARNSGIDVAVVPTGASSPEQLRAAQPDHYLDRFADVLKVVCAGVAV